MIGLSALLQSDFRRRGGHSLIETPSGLVSNTVFPGNRDVVEVRTILVLAIRYRIFAIKLCAMLLHTHILLSDTIAYSSEVWVELLLLLLPHGIVHIGTLTE